MICYLNTKKIVKQQQYHMLSISEAGFNFFADHLEHIGIFAHFFASIFNFISVAWCTSLDAFPRLLVQIENIFCCSYIH